MFRFVYVMYFKDKDIHNEPKQNKIISTSWASKHNIVIIVFKLGLRASMLFNKLLHLIKLEGLLSHSIGSSFL